MTHRRAARVTPARSYRSFWVMHRAYHRLTKRGLSRPRPDHWGMLGLTTVGRRTGRERSAILGYLEDGPNLVTLTLNGWADAEPAWWLNLQAHPDAVVELVDGTRPVRARAAEGDERARLWAEWCELGARAGEAIMADVGGSAGRLSRQVAVVVLEPRATQEPGRTRTKGGDEVEVS